jgi:hypothetical protein
MIVIITSHHGLRPKPKNKNYSLGLIVSTKKIEDINYINLLHGNSFKH